MDEQAQNPTGTGNTLVNIVSSIPDFSAAPSITDENNDLSFSRMKVLIIPTDIYLKHMNINPCHKDNLNVKYKLQIILNMVIHMVRQKKSPVYLFHIK